MPLHFIINAFLIFLKFIIKQLFLISLFLNSLNSGANRMQKYIFPKAAVDGDPRINCKPLLLY